jgi:hypothetical protein
MLLSLILLLLPIRPRILYRLIGSAVVELGRVHMSRPQLWRPQTQPFHHSPLLRHTLALRKVESCLFVICVLVYHDPVV